MSPQVSDMCQRCGRPGWGAGLPGRRWSCFRTVCGTGAGYGRAEAESGTEQRLFSEEAADKGQRWERKRDRGDHMMETESAWPQLLRDSGNTHSTARPAS